MTNNFFRVSWEKCCTWGSPAERNPVLGFCHNHHLNFPNVVHYSPIEGKVAKLCRSIEVVFSFEIDGLNRRLEVARLSVPSSGAVALLLWISLRLGVDASAGRTAIRIISTLVYRQRPSRNRKTLVINSNFSQNCTLCQKKIYQGKLVAYKKHGAARRRWIRLAHGEWKVIFHVFYCDFVVSDSFWML